MFDLNNPHNFVRVQELKLVSIEFFSIIVILIYIFYLWKKRRLNIEIIYFLSLPFTDIVFRKFSVQPAEILSIFLLTNHYKKFRATPVYFIALTLIAFSVISYINPNTPDFSTINRATGGGADIYGQTYSIMYSFRFLLTALVFSVLSRKKFIIPKSVIQFVVVFTFLVTFLQVFLWILGLPIDGIFYVGFPRAKGLSHEPGPWSIWVMSLIPYILYFRLGWKYFLLNFLTLICTFSAHGFISFFAFFVILAILSPSFLDKKIIRPKTLLPLIFFIMTIIVLAIIYQEKIPELLFPFVKVWEYLLQLTGQMEISATAGGRVGDIALFQEYFHEHWLLGIGSFNAVLAAELSPPQNAFIYLPVEIGLLGILILIFFWLLHYRELTYGATNIYFLAFCFTFLVMVSGVRCLTWHELWYAQATTLRLKRHKIH